MMDWDCSEIEETLLWEQCEIESHENCEEWHPHIILGEE